MKKWITFLQGNFRGNLSQVRIIRTLRKMRQHNISRDTIEGITDPIGYVFVGKVTEP